MVDIGAIHLHTLVGREIDPYIPYIARLRIEVFREWPYLYEGSLEEEKKYLKKFSRCEQAVFIVAFEGDDVVGISSGLPLTFEIPDFQKPFIEGKYDLNDYFYFSESILKKAYRGKGIGHEFFNLREAYVERLHRFHHITFAAVERDKDDPRKPEGYFELGSFWEKRGYVKHPELVCHPSWKEIGEDKPSPKPLTFWIKDL